MRVIAFCLVVIHLMTFNKIICGKKNSFHLAVGETVFTLNTGFCFPLHSCERIAKTTLTHSNNENNGGAGVIISLRLVKASLDLLYGAFLNFLPNSKLEDDERRSYGRHMIAALLFSIILQCFAVHSDLNFWVNVCR